MTAPSARYRKFNALVVTPLMLGLLACGSSTPDSQNTPPPVAPAVAPQAIIEPPAPAKDPATDVPGTTPSAPQSPSPGNRLSKDECKRFAEHFFTLMLKGKEGDEAEIIKQVADGMREDLIRDCLEKGTRAEVDCSFKATSMDELEKCGPSGQHPK